MVLPATLPRAAFADLLRVQDVTFTQQLQQQRSATGGGEVDYADRSPSMWKAECTSIPVPNELSEGLMAVLNSRAGGLKSLLLYNYKLPYPSTDPEGLLLAAGSTLAASLSLDFTRNEAFIVTPSAQQSLLAIKDRLHVGFGGLPAALTLPFGTYFSITWDSGRYYLGQLVETVTSNAAGVVESVEIWPPLPASIAAGVAVTFSKPPGKFRIVPGKAYPSIVESIYSTISFTAEQTYRR